MDSSIKIVNRYNSILLRCLWSSCISVLILFVLAKSAYSDNLFVSRIGLEQGLSQNNVTAIVQDRKGFMWFGTQTALNRYDGYSFKKYTREDEGEGGISNGSTWALLVDKEGVLWVGTYGGLNRYDEQSDRFSSYQNDPEDSESLSHDNVWSLYEDTQGSLWIGTGKGLNRLDRNSGKFTRFLNDSEDEASISNDVISVIYQDKQGHLWIGTDSGLNRYDYDAEHFEKIDDSNAILSKAVVTTITESGSGELWVGTDGNGIFILDQSGKVIDHKVNQSSRKGSITTDKIKIMLRDKKDQLWIGTDNGGLNRYDPSRDRFVHYKNNPSNPNSLSENTIFSLYEDKTGVLWIGTYTQGISKVNPFGFSLTLGLDYASLENPDPHTDIRGFLMDRHKNLWVASSSNGIRVSSPDGERISYVHDPNDPHSIANNKTYSLYEDKKGVVWVGAANGILHEFNEKMKRFTRYKIDTLSIDGVRHGKILAINEDSKGLLWLGDERGGAHTFDRKTKQFTHYHNDPNDPNSISFNRVFDLYINEKDEIWFSTYGGGVSRYDPRTNQFTTYKNIPEDPSSISDDYVSCLVVDETDKNIAWLGVSGQGLERMDLEAGTFTHFGPQDGLADNNVYGIVQEGNDLWMGHNNGLSRFNIKTKEFSNYEQQDGLQNNEYNGGAYYKDADGKLYLGGIVGYNAFYTDQIVDNPYKPAIYITEFQLFNKTVAVGEGNDGRVLLERSIVDTKQITLSHKDTVFSFAFAALDYAFSAKNQYAYKLEGLEDEWNYVDSSRRYATYTTLTPGDYTFRVKGTNNNGVWSEEGAAIALTVTPPFWQTWWFRTVSAVLILLVVFSVYAYRVKAIQERNRLLKEQVKEATSELQKEKSNLEATLVELGETKDALIESAHKAGMADIATGVLHNVGNLLNSVNTSTGILRETISSSVAKRFLKAADLLLANKEHMHEYVYSDPKGRKLLEYFVSLIDPFKRESELMTDNVNRLTQKIGSIGETVSAQQIHAKGGVFVESLPLEKLVEEAIMLQSGSITRHEINIDRLYDKEMPDIKIQKTKLIQVLINLIVNAKESMDDCANRESLLKIEIKRDDDNAYVIFIDNGTGIEKDKLESIFAHGYTTKSDGHGFGLHSCANYMTEMGGRLWAESDGLDKGARFILSFPLKGKDQNSEEGVDAEERKMA